ncbi:hypothetical protein [Poriferisphaera sp. WC338]|uniref:hypothetical protein n=1 Tax=Poriferisphaera sp. WC338 TaxID=3425129 RepID=UPI003D81AB47
MTQTSRASNSSAFSLRSLAIGICCIAVIVIAFYETYYAINLAPDQQDNRYFATHLQIRDNLRAAKLHPDFPQQLYMPQSFKENTAANLGHTLSQQELFPTLVSTTTPHPDQLLFFNSPQQAHAYLQQHQLQPTFVIADTVVVARKAAP